MKFKKALLFATISIILPTASLAKINFENQCIDVILGSQAIGESKGSISAKKAFKYIDQMKVIAVGASLDRVCACTKKIIASSLDTEEELDLSINTIKSFVFTSILKTKDDVSAYISRYGDHKVVEMSPEQLSSLYETFTYSVAICKEQHDKNPFSSNFY